jgi:hypothetical protein
VVSFEIKVNGHIDNLGVVIASEPIKDFGGPYCALDHLLPRQRSSDRALYVHSRRLILRLPGRVQ